MRTYMANAAVVSSQWYLVDATNCTLGRLASELAFRLRGKHKVDFTPHVDMGDFFVVTNVEKMHFTGNKMSDKMYYRHTGYPGGIRSVSLKDMLSQHPDRVLRLAVKGMLPRGPLGRRLLTKLKPYAGNQHPHQAQKPLTLSIAQRNQEQEAES